MPNYNFLFKIYGVRGSYPIAPVEGTQFGGNTTCVMARTPDHVVIFDAGSGIIPLGKELLPEILEHQKKSDGPFHITILFTHTHIDHILGLPYFTPIYMPQVHLHFVGPPTVGVDFETILRTQVLPQYFPVSMDEFRSQKSFYNVSENTFVYFNDSKEPVIGDVRHQKPGQFGFRIDTMKYYFHPKDGTYLYNILWNDHKITFATDIEGYKGGDQRLIKFAQNADILIHDAQYTEEQYKMFCGYGHSSFVMACDTAREAGAKKLLLFHHDPNNSDEQLKTLEKDAQKLFPQAELAKEGWSWQV
ncbi:beta-lactamase domain-containing protein [Caldithrix abyssi DSM 13497]|uniref:Beta-lactamase domain-containing protein n=1 Tax=Caldithrix abyssi DSM 13497 TaxID=880073 RepID=H1XR07_CALAY|nr:MBL fold metallo-hydrolase [Caldithrix abyssi]APF20022.1 Ribonuclease BN, tRNA processing enzyme [Caldithrix abyssi DSM 13497]EHO40101.1 beta-lactamase domain-containing protein [Caldithrix abyssi DSM 13497]